MLAFPSTYSVGITSLGYQIVWATLAQRSDVDVRRLFTDQGDAMPRQIDLFGLSLSWELDGPVLPELLRQEVARAERALSRERARVVSLQAALSHADGYCTLHAHMRSSVPSSGFIWGALRKVMPPGACEGVDNVRHMRLTA
ncbi:MAG: hypothetical protein ACPGPH_00435, partial [Synechococcus sp.]